MEYSLIGGGNLSIPSLKNQMKTFNHGTQLYQPVVRKLNILNCSLIVKSERFFKVLKYDSDDNKRYVRIVMVELEFLVHRNYICDR